MNKKNYVLDDQIGFLMRRATQRHLAIFARAIPDLTPTQFATIAKLQELGAQSQNHLGRQTSMDAATIKGVIDRLASKGLVSTSPHPDDKRRVLVDLSDKGRALFDTLGPKGTEITRDTLDPLTPAEQKTLLRLLAKLI